MKKSGKICAAILILSIIFTSALKSEKNTALPFIIVENKEYVSITAIIQSLNIDSSFDIITGRGKLFWEGSVAVYQTGLSVMLINGNLFKSSNPVIRKEGEILLPQDLALNLLNCFFPEMIITINKNYILIKPATAAAKGAVKPEKQKKETAPEAPRDRISFIIIDPGHGGKDPGAIGKGGIKEKTVTLEVAKKLADYLSENLKGINIILTRSNDAFIELGKRTDIANGRLKEHENGIFISIHVNASISPRISGFETYFLSQNPSNEDARATAALENNVIILEEKSRKKIYDDADHIEAFMFTTQIQKESRLLAEAIQSEMEKIIREFKSRRVRKADFFVLRGSLMPAALVEIGFITNQKEAVNLKKDSYQDKIIDGIGRGVITFIKKYNNVIKIK